MNRAVTYARVSGDDRHTEGRNLSSQSNMTREYALEHGYQIVKELAEDDRGANGASFELEQLNLAREMAHNNQFDVLIVREMDRLSRNLAKQLLVEEELKHNNVRIEYVLGEYPDTPEGALMKHLKASIAEYERMKTRERTSRGRRDKAASGKLVGNCLPYGYKKVGDRHEAQVLKDDDEVKIIKQIFRWFLTEKTSMRQIAQRLTDDGVTIRGVAYNRPGVAVWSSNIIRRILANKSYIGQFSHSGVLIYRPDLAIIEPGDFQLVQEILADNIQWQRKKGRDATPGRYLLLDHFYCSCDYRMTGNTQNPGGKQYIYYQCVTRSYPAGKKTCKEIAVRVSKVDEIVWAWLKILLSMDERLLRKGLNQIKAEREDKTQSKRESMNAANVKIESIGKKIAGLMRTFEGDEDEDVIATLQEQINVLKKTKAELIAQRDKLIAELSQKTLSEEQIDDIVTFAREIRGKMETENYEYKKQVLRLLNVRVDLVHKEDCHTLDMSCALPGAKHSEVLRLWRSYSSNKYVVSP